ncbi:unnamed protein product [Lota lota]
MAKVVCVIVAVLAYLMLADSLVCNKCSIGLVGFCLNSNTETCSTNTSVCFTGKASFPSLSVFSGFNSQGCREQAGCNATTTSSLINVNFTTEVNCCSTDKCNPITVSGASTTKLSLVAVFASALLVSGWSTLYASRRVPADKTFPLISSALHSAAHGLTCRRCPIGILGTCLFSSDVDCDNSTRSCFFGDAGFNATGLFRLHNRGCVDSSLCDKTQLGSILGADYTSGFSCCKENLCNGVTSVQLSLAAVCAATLVSLWAS